LAESISRGIDQLGKDYDFNFDVETLDKIVCSELIYIVFGQVHWNTEYDIGRPTISPDNVVEVLFQKDTKFSFLKYLIKHSSNNLENKNLEALGLELDFEMRSSDGGPIIRKDDPNNLFWKKDERCYTLRDTPDGPSTKVCKTSYTLQTYEENLTEN